MRYELHPNLMTPPDDTIVWRYMEFAKFVDLLENGLRFCRTDKLDDPREGRFTDAELEHLRTNRTMLHEAMSTLTRIFVNALLSALGMRTLPNRRLCGISIARDRPQLQLGLLSDV
jgi:hypothetical protein